MWIDWVPLTTLATWPSNPKAHDHATLGESFDRFGFIDPIILDEGSGKIVAGHGRRERLLQMKDAGMPAPGRVRVREDGEWLVPVLRGITFSSEHEAEAYLLANNQTVIKGGYDEGPLAEMLQRHSENLSGLGWNQDEVGDLVASIAKMSEPPPVQEAPQDFKEFDEGQKRTHACPRCSFPVVCDTD
jgi:ParB-like chromosome segregation protein Spo0J